MARDSAGTLALLIDGDNASPKIVGRVNHCFPRLSDLVSASGLVDVERALDNPKTVLVRLKRKSPGKTK